MHVFRDNHGRQWTIQIHVSAVKRVRGLMGLDLYSLVDDRFSGLAKILSDVVSFIDVIYCLIKEDADRLNVSDEDFGRAMGGDAIEHARIAFIEELTDFFPDPRVRAGMRKVMEAGEQVRSRLLDRMEESLAAIDPDSEARRLIGSSGNSRESPESIPIPSRSAS